MGPGHAAETLELLLALRLLNRRTSLARKETLTSGTWKEPGVTANFQQLSDRSDWVTIIIIGIVIDCDLWAALPLLLLLWLGLGGPSSLKQSATRCQMTHPPPTQ